MPQVTEVRPDDFRSGPAGAVHRVAAACDAADGVDTLNEQVQLELKHRGLDRASLWLAEEDDEAPAGFALLHGDDELELAVHPDTRDRGIGRLLADRALAGIDRVDAWSHADHPAAARLAARFDVPRERELVVMTRPTSLPVGESGLPDDVTIRTFRPEDPDDAAALLEVNAAAFRHHPEQGEMSAADFRERTGEAWFDPEGLFLAVPTDPDDDRLLGFHWTKVHRSAEGDVEPPYGEVYVVAVNPRAAGRGLGKALTRAGLDHLARTGVDRVVLYVDGDNAPAVALYEGLGFTRTRVEAQYRGTPHPAAAVAGGM
ncbi:MAG: mycothiol synthase [Marmoricola sp.]